MRTPVVAIVAIVIALVLGYVAGHTFGGDDAALKGAARPTSGVTQAVGTVALGPEAPSAKTSGSTPRREGGGAATIKRTP